MKRTIPSEITDSLQAITVFRGIYKRVARQLGIDPSYVSRVARGERRAAFVTDALEKEIRRAMGKARLQAGRSVPASL
jgi:DNA-binding SARP family transcriptional activator